MSLDELLGSETVDAALVLGTGGASQAVQYVLAQRDIPFAIVSRDAAKGNYTYDDLDSEAISTHHLVINTTPVGMYPKVDQAPEIPYELLTPSHRLFDLIYNPEQTLFARRGAERGARTMTGVSSHRYPLRRAATCPTPLH